MAKIVCLIVIYSHCSPPPFFFQNDGGYGRCPFYSFLTFLVAVSIEKRTKVKAPKRMQLVKGMAELLSSVWLCLSL